MKKFIYTSLIFMMILIFSTSLVVSQAVEIPLKIELHFDESEDDLTDTEQTETQQDISFLRLNSGPPLPSNPEMLTNTSGLTETKNLTKRIDTYLTQSKENGFSGSVMVAVKGQIILSKGYDWADRSRKIPNAPSTVFNIGSVTKQFTAAGILKLMEQGKLKLSDKITRFFPEAPADKKDITLQQLLTHTSGVSPTTGGFRYNEATKEQFLEEFFQSELLSEPKENQNHHYANANYIMLTAILEMVSGQNYASFLRKYLWDSVNRVFFIVKSKSFIYFRLAKVQVSRQME